MKCPYCNSSETKVLDKRESENEETTRRRRECLICLKRFTTYEKIEDIDLSVIKKSGTLEPFDINKVINGIKRACQKRPIAEEKIVQIAKEVETEIRKQPSTEIKSKFIGEMIMQKLLDHDEVAYVRFASVYKEFKTAEQFIKEIEKNKIIVKKR